MFGNFGDTLKEAKRSEFFVFFHLKETDRKDTNGLATLTFRPTSAQFHDLVAIQMTMDDKGQLLGAALVIRRAFIDHSEISSFAADITKSFLVAALDESDLQLIGEAAMQIRAYESPGSRVQAVYVGNRAPQPLAPGEGELEYLVYAGKRRQAERPLKTVNLKFANETVDGVEQLTITIIPK